MGTFFRIVSTLLLCASQAVLAQTYPGKPVRIVVPFPPGGVNDIVARLVGAKLQESWGQAVIIDNKPGANSIIGSEFVARSAPDGYTLLVNAIGGMSINPLLYSNLPYDGYNAFAPVSMLVVSPMVLGVNASLPAGNLQEFIAYARANPGKLNNSAGSTTSQVAAEMFKQMTGTRMTSIPYKGSAQSVQAVAAGDAQMVVVDNPALLPQVRSGRVRALAVAWPKRLAAIPDVPTFAEAGLPEYEMAGWVGLFAPAGTPAPVIAKLSADAARVVHLPDMREKLGTAIESVGSSPEQLAETMRSDAARYAPVIKAANIKPE
jgi:tripartite-type tricarboxylate transporter receptor subunit TctC